MKKILRWPVRLAALLFVVVGLCLILGFVFFDGLFHWGLKRATAGENFDLQAGRARLLGSQIQVENVQLRTRSGDVLLTIDRMTAQLQPYQGWRLGGWAWLGDVDASGLSATVAIDANGALNWAQIASARARGDSQFWRVYRGTVRFDRGFVSYRDVRDTGFVYNLSDLAGKLHFDPDRPAQLAVEARTAEQGKLHLGGSVGLAEPELKLGGDFQNITLSDLAEFPALGHQITVDKGKVSGSLTLAGKAPQWTHIAQHLLLSGRVHLAEATFRLPKLKTPLERFTGEVQMVGSNVQLKGFQGRLLNNPVALSGSVTRWQEGLTLDLAVTSRKFELASLAHLLQPQPRLRGTAALDLRIEGEARDPSVRGTISLARAQLEQYLLERIWASFKVDRESLEIEKLEAYLNGGLLEASGLVFLDKDRQLFLSLNAENAALQSLGLSNGSFRGTAIGKASDPLIFGKGSVSGLPANPLGATSASGSIVADRKGVVVWDGQVGDGYKVPYAMLDTGDHFVAGTVEAKGARLPDVQVGKANIRTQVDASVSFWGDLDQPREMRAAGQILDGIMQVGQEQPFQNLRGPISWSQGVAAAPSFEASWGPGTVSGAASYEPGNHHFQLFAQGHGVNLQPLVSNPWYHLPLAFAYAGDTSLVWDFLPSRGSAFQAVASSAAGNLATVGVIRPHSPVALVGWADGLDLGSLGVPGIPAGNRYDGMLGLSPEGPNLEFFYDGQARGAQLVGHGSFQRDFVSLEQAWFGYQVRRPGQMAWTRLEGQAYPFLGPDVAPPLKHVRMSAVPPGLDWSTLEAHGRIGLRDRPVALEFATSGLDLNWLPRQVFPSRSFLGAELVEGLLDAHGRVTGTLRHPQVTLDLQAPWLGLRRPDGEGTTSYLSAAGRLIYQDGTLSTKAFRVSPRPYDDRLLNLAAARLPDYRELVRLNGILASARGLDVKLASAGFPLTNLRPLLPPAWQLLSPGGRLRTRNLHFWGPARSVSAAGRLDLTQGSVRLSGGDVPLDQAYVEFSSQPGTFQIPDALVQSGPVELHGRGSRSVSGRVQGDLWAANVPLDYFHPLGQPWSDWKGNLSFAASLQGQGGQLSDINVAMSSDRLEYGDSLVTLEDLVFGRIHSQDGRLLTDAQSGVRLHFGNGQVAADIPADAASVRLAGGGTLSAEGRLAASSLPGGSLVAWLTGEKGPEFGSGERPFRLGFQQLAWPLLSRLVGYQPPVGHAQEGSLTGELRLLGQWDRDHRVGVGPRKPQVLADLMLQSLEWMGTGPQGSTGVRLDQPLQIQYERKDNRGWLHVPPAALSFFRKATAANATETSQGKLAGQADLILTDVPEIKHNTKSVPGQQVKIALENLPLENLNFFFPQLNNLTGTLNRLELENQGALLTPTARLDFDLGKSQIGAVSLAKATGTLRGVTEESGKIRLTLDDHDALQIFFGQTPSTEQLLSLRGDLDLGLERSLTPRRDRLSPVWQGWGLRGDSQLNVHGDLKDSQMSLVQAFLANSTTTGRLTGNLDLTGTLDSPELAGLVQLENGSLAHPALHTSLTGLNMLARFEKIPADQAEGAKDQSSPPSGLVSRYTLERLSGLLGGRTFEGSGKAEVVGLQPYFLDMNFAGKDLPLDLEGFFKGRADADFHLAARHEATADGSSRLVPAFTGSLRVPEGDMTIPLDLLSQNAEPSRWSTWLRNSPVRYDIDVRLGDDVWVGLYNSNVRVQGDLKVLPSPKTNTPVLAGELFLSRGIIRIPLYEVNFRVRQGYAHFDNSLNPRLDNVEADTNLGNYQISARFDGTFPDIRADLVSNPPLGDADLQRLVGLGTLAGYTGSASLPISQQDQGGALLANQGFTFLSNLLTQNLTQDLGRALFLSEVSIDYAPPSEYVIRVAKSLNERDTILLTFLQVVRTGRYNNNEQQYGVEWRFQPNLLSRISVDNYGQARLWFQGVLRF